MSYELLVGIVVVNCAVTLWLWTALKNTARIKADTPPRTVLNEKIAREFWDGKPISPPSEPPDATGTIESLSGGPNPNLREFFQDFEQFVSLANHHLAEDYKEVNFRFRLKDLPDTEDDRMPIRRFQIFYNRTAVGDLRISPSFYDRVNYHVSSRFLISAPRWLEYDELVGFIHTMSNWVTGSTLSEYNDGLGEHKDDGWPYVSPKSRQKAKELYHIIELEMLTTLWSNYTYSGLNRYSRGPNYFGELKVRVDGSAYNYIERRDRLNSREPARPKPDLRFNDRGPFRRP